MIVDVADVGLLFGVDDGVGVALEVERGVTGVDEDAAEIDELALDGEDGLEDLGRRLLDDTVFEVVDAVVEGVDGREIEIDDGIEDEVEELAGSWSSPSRRARSRACSEVGQVGSAMVMRKSLPAKMSMGVKVGMESDGSSGLGSRRTGLKTAKV